MRRHLVAFASGCLFGAGLTVSGMTQPSKVLGFLDVAGTWDPSLALVMLGALGVHFMAMRWAANASSPFFADRFQIAPKRAVDAPLVTGAALFGVGWGLAGYCPGPALTSLGALAPTTLVFVGAMLVGMVLFASVEKRLAARQERPPRGEEAGPSMPVTESSA